MRNQSRINLACPREIKKEGELRSFLEEKFEDLLLRLVYDLTEEFFFDAVKPTTSGRNFRAFHPPSSSIRPINLLSFIGTEMG